MDFSLLSQAVPLTAIICLVYSATRFELREKILRSALAMFIKTMVFLGVLYLFLVWFSR
ncbi:MAG: hypothetical protein ACKO2P_08975 [Planctomycetota bacterium]